MSYKIRFKHSDKQAITEYGESVLEGVIRAGLNVDYGCNNGNCGRCSARVIEGDIQKVRHYDYVQSAAEKMQKHFLMCSYAAASNLVLETWLDGQSMSISEQGFRAKVKKLIRISDDVCIMILRPPRGLRLRFLAGQYAWLSSAHFDKVQCSIASCPCEDKQIEFHVPRGYGQFGDYVFEMCRVGDELDVAAPFGDFVFKENLQGTTLFIAFGVGFAPIKSLIEHISSREEEKPLYLYRITITDDKPYLDNLCRSWNDAFDHFTYMHLTLGGKSDEILRERVQYVTDQHTDLVDSGVYLSASETVSEIVADTCIQHGFHPERLFREVVRGMDW